jgi:hypothetical protein
VAWIRRADQAGGGLAVDVGLYLLSAVFAGVTAATSTLAAHRAWGAVAAVGYGAATVLAAIQWATRTTTRARGVLAVVTFGAVALLPLVWQSLDRAAGRADRAQEEVVVIEHGAARLVESGTPYLSRAAIAALPAGDRLLAYLPYQPGMAVFGLPRAEAGGAAWTDAPRVVRGVDRGRAGRRGRPARAGGRGRAGAGARDPGRHRDPALRAHPRHRR